MSPLTHLPQHAVDLVITCLLPLLLPIMDDDRAAARALALRMLADHQPESVRELNLAGEIIGFGLNSMTALAECGAAGAAADKVIAARRWACGLSKAGYQAQRRLDEIQRKRHAEAAERATEDAQPPAATPAPEAPATPEPAAVEPAAAAPAPIEAATAKITPAVPSPDLIEAEAAFTEANLRLTLMKSRHKGAPPPHTQAAQQIAAQQRIVATARLKLEQTRLRHARATAAIDPFQANPAQAA